MTAIPRAELEAEFVAALRAKWARGAAEYGDASFHAKPFDTVDEILEEILDIAGWAFVLWVQLRLRLGGVLLAANRLQPPAAGGSE